MRRCCRAFGCASVNCFNGLLMSKHFVVCVQKNGCADLELHKLYQVLPDGAAEADGLLRIIDESGEDYLYPAECFVAT